MAWNDNNNQTPPELDEVIKDFKNKFNSTFGGKTPGNSGASTYLYMWLEFHDMCRSFGSIQGTLMWPPMLKFEFPSKEIWIKVKE